MKSGEDLREGPGPADIINNSIDITPQTVIRRKYSVYTRRKDVMYACPLHPVVSLHLQEAAYEILITTHYKDDVPSLLRSNVCVQRCHSLGLCSAC